MKPSIVEGIYLNNSVSSIAAFGGVLSPSVPQKRKKKSDILLDALKFRNDRKMHTWFRLVGSIITTVVSLLVQLLYMSDDGRDVWRPTRRVPHRGDLGFRYHINGAEVWGLLRYAARYVCCLQSCNRQNSLRSWTNRKNTVQFHALD